LGYEYFESLFRPTGCPQFLQAYVGMVFINGPELLWESIDSTSLTVSLSEASVLVVMR